MSILLPVLATLILWWASTGAVLVLGERSSGARKLAFGIANLLALGGLAAIWLTRDMATPLGAYAAALSALALWAWHEMSFLFGYITGSNRAPCPQGISGFSRFRSATDTLIHHELALAATVIGLGVMSYGSANAAGFLVFVMLFLLRLSSKLNLFTAAPHFTDQFLPARLSYLHSYFSPNRVGWFFAFSTSAIALAAAALLWGAANAATPFEAAILALLGALAALGALEHLFLAIPVPDAALWKWLLPERDPRRAQDL